MADETMYSLVPVYRSPPTGSAITTVAFSPEGQRLAFGDQSGRLVTVSDLLGSQTRELDVFLGTEVQIVALRWWTPVDATLGTSASHTHLVAGDSAGYLHFLPHASVTSKFTTRVHSGCVEDIAVDPSGNLVGTASADEVRIWKVQPTGYLEPLPPLRFPEEHLPLGIRSLGFGPTYVHVSDTSLTTYTFDKWTGVLINSTKIETSTLRNAVWVGHNPLNNTPCFAFNDRTAGFVYQEGDKRTFMPYPHHEERSTVLAVDSGRTELVGGGANRRVLVFDLVSGRRVQHLSDNPIEASGWIRCVAVKKTNARALIAAGVPVSNPDISNSAEQFRVVVWTKARGGRYSLHWTEIIFTCLSMILATAAYYISYHL